MAGIDQDTINISIDEYVSLIETLGLNIIDGCNAVARSTGVAKERDTDRDDDVEWVYPCNDLKDRWCKLCLCIKSRYPVKRVMAEMLMDIHKYSCYDVLVRYIFKLMDMPIIKDLP